MQGDYTKIRMLADFLLKTMWARRQTLRQVFKIPSQKKSVNPEFCTNKKFLYKINTKPFLNIEKLEEMLKEALWAERNGIMEIWSIQRHEKIRNGTT